MTIVTLAILIELQDAEPLQTAKTGAAHPWSLVASKGGKYIAILGSGSVEIRDSENLEIVKALPVAASAVQFNQRDRELALAGQSLELYSTRDWTRTFQAPLPEADKAGPGQAVFAWDGSAYYVAGSTHLCRAWEDGGQLVQRSLPISPSRLSKKEIGPRLRLWGFSEDTLLLSAHKESLLGVYLKERFYPLTYAESPIAVEVLEDRVVAVFGTSIVYYEPRSFKSMSRPIQIPSCSAATVDPVTRSVFFSSKEGLRAFPIDNPNQSKPIHAASFTSLAVHSASRRLYGLESSGALRSWKLR